jgi:hypothetical protein
LKLFVLVFASLLVMARAEARVFNMGAEKFAGYFIGSAGTSTIAKSAFLDEDAATTTYSDSVANNLSGEVGFMYAMDFLSLRFGFEIFRPSMLKDVTASNVGGTAIYSLNSDITGYVPKLGLEINLQKTTNYRAFFQAYAGTASVSYKNEYTIISYGGQSNHTVEGKGSTSMYGGTLGVESHLTDATTYIFEFGYRKMVVDNLKYSKDVTTFSGAKVAGDPVTDVNGNARVFDFTGAYMTFGFRFYL